MVNEQERKCGAVDYEIALYIGDSRLVENRCKRHIQPPLSNLDHRIYRRLVILDVLNTSCNGLVANLVFKGVQRTEAMYFMNACG